MPQAAPDSRWITVREQYDHIWPSRASTKYLPGEYRVKNAVADGAIAKGKAVEGRLDGSEATPPKPPASKRKTKRARKPKVAGDGATSNAGSDVRVAEPHLAADDSAEVRSGVDTAAG